MDSSDLPEWAHSMWREIGSPPLGKVASVLKGELLDRRSGLRKDDLIEIYLDPRSLPEGSECVRRGRLLSTGKSSLEILDENRYQRFIAREFIVEVVLVTHIRPGYLDDNEMHSFEKEDMKRRRELQERSDITDKGDEQGFWG